jgi:hypothetical protein
MKKFALAKFCSILVGGRELRALVMVVLTGVNQVGLYEGGSGERPPRKASFEMPF